jgi:8-oxo-dGTP pyrophosphatase MutT (NUDIX family)
LRVALKEAREESGIDGIREVLPTIFDLDIHEIPEHNGIPRHFHYDVRFLLAAPHRNVVISDESHDLAWTSMSEILESPFMSASIKRMASKWITMKP